MPKFIPLILAGLMPLSALHGKAPLHSTVSEPVSPPPIHQVILEKLQDDGILDIRIVIGFLDGPAEEKGPDQGKHRVYNRRVMREVYDKLTSMGFDGFTVHPKEFGIDSEETLSGDEFFGVQAPAQSGEGIVRVTVMNSSLLNYVEEIDTDPNKAEKQVIMSVRARKFLLESIKQSDVPGYLGHSREEGGPDTFPPIYGADGHVDYDLYGKQLRGILGIEKAVIERGSAPPVLAIISCKSDCHFGKRIENWGKRTGQPFYFMGTEDYAYMDEDAGAVGALLTGLMASEQPEALDKRLNREIKDHPLSKPIRTKDVIFRFRPIRGR